MSSTMKRMLSLQKKGKSGEPQSSESQPAWKRMSSFRKARNAEEEEPVAGSFSIDHYKKENEELEAENTTLRQQLHEHRQTAMNAVHETVEKRAQLEKTLQGLQEVETQLEAVYDRAKIRKAIRDAISDTSISNYREVDALKMLKQTEKGMEGAKTNVGKCITALKGYLKE